MKKSVLAGIGVIAVVVVIAVLVYYFIPQPIREIKNEDYIGKKVSVRGTVESTLKIGQLSGYTLRDKNGDKIPVASDTLPKEGTTKTTSGILRRNILIGYYIEEED